MNFIKNQYELFSKNFIPFSIIVTLEKENVICPENIKQLKITKFIIGETTYYEILEDGLSIPLILSGVKEQCFFPWNSIVGVASEYFSLAQTKEYEAPLPDAVEKEIQNKEPIEEDDYILQDTKYPHLKLVVKKS